MDLSTYWLFSHYKELTYSDSCQHQLDEFLWIFRKFEKINQGIKQEATVMVIGQVSKGMKSPAVLIWADLSLASARGPRTRPITKGVSGNFNLLKEIRICQNKVWPSHLQVDYWWLQPQLHRKLRRQELDDAPEFLSPLRITEEG